ncbi:AAA family ATPase [Cohnella cholangitidis]|uniref:AAA family ATPase n=1 Tax=Cohnella cholangitidis TaxID=2598458 RepID=A0A7G5BXW8_9BACL|nr:AAA family ATPase [Cohnella cholangitidis]QMV41802.1 AAA family ATPase [Cohnella cholangitidis]
MIIWINGAFGAGKTQTAYELHRRLERSYVYDPENAGYFIGKNVPKSICQNDFQDYSMWREFNYSMLKHLDLEFGGVIIAPMTVVSLQYFDEIVGRLRKGGVVVHHFTLCASRETLKKRLRSRGEGGKSWAAEQMDRCIEGLSDEAFQHHIDTDDRSISDNAELIASLSNLELLPDNRSMARKALDRWITQIKHIRFFG